MCGFIAQLVEHRTGIAEVTSSNPFEALIFSAAFSFLGFRVCTLVHHLVLFFSLSM